MLYADKVSNGPLKDFISKINIALKPLDLDDIRIFIIVSLPPEGGAKQMAISDKDEDSAEFILYLDQEYRFPDLIKRIYIVLYS